MIKQGKTYDERYQFSTHIFNFKLFLCYSGVYLTGVFFIDNIQYSKIIYISKSSWPLLLFTDEREITYIVYDLSLRWADWSWYLSCLMGGNDDHDIKMFLAVKILSPDSSKCVPYMHLLGYSLTKYSSEIPIICLF